eukprot:6543020-Alexandrium_andersonii.AAC.1
METHRYLALAALASFYEQLEGAGFQLSTEAARTIERTVGRFLRHYKWLALKALEDGVFAWKLVTKHHYFEHIAMAARFLNPRVGWTYQYENMVQKVLRVAKACANGTPPHRIGVPLMHKYRNVLNVCLR